MAAVVPIAGAQISGNPRGVEQLIFHVIRRDFNDRETGIALNHCSLAAMHSVHVDDDLVAIFRTKLKGLR